MSHYQTIEYRGIIIDVSLIRDMCSRTVRVVDGIRIPWYSPEELEKEVQKRIRIRKMQIGRMLGPIDEDKNGGYRLKIYQQERELYPKSFKIKITDKEAEKLVKKLYRHFYRICAKNINVRFWGRRGGGMYYSGGNIRLSHNPSIGVICHEVAHHKYWRHSKKMLKFIGKLINYCKKKGYMK